jgi:uncharacterized membrane protein
MTIFYTLMRIIHIAASVFWAGSAFFLLRVLLPTVQDAGPEGGKFMQRLAMSGRLGQSFAIASGTTVLSGALAFYPATGGLNMDFLRTTHGIVLTLGAVFGILAFLHGMLITSPVTRRSAELAKQMAARQGPPDPEQLKEAQALGAKLGEYATHSAILIGLALLGMAAAQTL